MKQIILSLSGKCFTPATLLYDELEFSPFSVSLTFCMDCSTKPVSQDKKRRLIALNGQYSIHALV